MPRITQAQKNDWLIALRGGEFSQGTGKLRTPDGYCCLGVLSVACKLDQINEFGSSRNGYDVFNSLFGRGLYHQLYGNDSICSNHEIEVCRNYTPCGSTVEAMRLRVGQPGIPNDRKLAYTWETLPWIGPVPLN